MSTIKSSAEHLTVTSDGTNKHTYIQDNGVTKVATTTTGIDVTGSVTCDAFTSTGIDDNATSTAIIIDSSENTSLVGKDTNTGYDTYLKIYGNSAPTSNVNRWAGLAVYNNGGNNVNELAFFTGSGDGARAEQAKLGTSGDLTLQGSIKFNGDTATANALDDYEEGNWTPTLYPGTQSYSQQIGKYTKLGNVVHVSCVLLMSSTSVTGSARIDGLPYQPSGTPYYIPSTSAAEYMSITANHNFQAIQYGNNSFVYLFEEDANGGMQQLSNTSKFTNASGMYFTLTYNTNA
jgi:hypothetical protein